MYDYPKIWSIRKEKGLKWDYNIGLVGSAFIELWQVTNDERYFRYAKSYADTMLDKQGNIRGYKTEDYNLDNIKPGKMLFDYIQRPTIRVIKLLWRHCDSSLITIPKRRRAAFGTKKDILIKFG